MAASCVYINRQPCLPNTTVIGSCVMECLHCSLPEPLELHVLSQYGIGPSFFFSPELLQNLKIQNRILQLPRLPFTWALLQSFGHPVTAMAGSCHSIEPEEAAFHICHRGNRKAVVARLSSWRLRKVPPCVLPSVV